MNSPTLSEITVVLADDHGIVREGIAALCAANGLTVVGQCSDGQAAFEMIQSLSPDFAILDLHMPVLTGVEVIRKVRAAGMKTKLMVLSISRDDQEVVAAVRAGADGYLLKDGPGRHLVEAVNFIRDGGVYVSPQLRGAAIFQSAEASRDQDPLAALSAREAEVFHHLVNGLRPKDIAELLDISAKTLDTYRASVMRKLNRHDLVALVKFAIEHKLTSISQP